MAKNLNQEVAKSVRLTKQLSIDKINEEIANNWHWLSPKRKRDLKNLITDTWNYAAKYSAISKTKIIVTDE